jgi:hypothetical protein
MLEVAKEIDTQKLVSKVAVEVPRHPKEPPRKQERKNSELDQTKFE